MTPLAARAARIEPFHVMEVVKQAEALARAGRSVIHLSIGEPDFTAAEPVRRAAALAIEEGRTQYTPALGLPLLRERIAEWYATRFGASVDPAAIAVTAGASGALLLTCAALVERDTEVLMPDPSYPCNRHFITAFEGRARSCAHRTRNPFPVGRCVGGAALGRRHAWRTRRVAVKPDRHFDRFQ